MNTGFTPTFSGDPRLVQAITAHLEKHFGPTAMLAEKIPGDPPMAVFIGRPSESNPFFSLVTCGMASSPAQIGRTELALHLPPDWPMQRLRESGEGYWVVRLLKAVARYPSQTGEPIGVGHTIPTGNLIPPEYEFTAVTLSMPYALDVKCARFTVPDGREVGILCVLPLRSSEAEFIRQNGIDEFIERAESLDLLEDVILFRTDRGTVA